MKHTAALLALLALPAHAGDWTTPFYDDTDNGYFVHTVSERFNNSMMGLWAYPSNGCQAMAGIISSYSDSEVADPYMDTASIRVDGGKIFTLPVKVTTELFSPEIAASTGKVSRQIQMLDMTNKDDLGQAMHKGVSMIYKIDGGQTDEFSLMGISVARDAVVAACKKLGTDDEWDSGAKKQPVNEWNA